jgi:hypothetical protein
MGTLGDWARQDPARLPGTVRLVSRHSALRSDVVGTSRRTVGGPTDLVGEQTEIPRSVVRTRNAIGTHASTRMNRERLETNQLGIDLGLRIKDGLAKTFRRGGKVVHVAEAGNEQTPQAFVPPLVVLV